MTIDIRKCTPEIKSRFRHLKWIVPALQPQTSFSIVQFVLYTLYFIRSKAPVLNNNVQHCRELKTYFMKETTEHSNKNNNAMTRIISWSKISALITTWKFIVVYTVHRESHMKPVHRTITYSFFKIYFNNILLFPPGSPNYSNLFTF